MTPGSAVGLATVARHVTDCATRLVTLLEITCCSSNTIDKENTKWQVCVSHHINKEKIDLVLFSLGNFSCFLSSADFFKTTFLLNSFRKTIRVPKSLDPDQAHIMSGPGPDLG